MYTHRREREKVGERERDNDEREREREGGGRENRRRWGCRFSGELQAAAVVMKTKMMYCSSSSPNVGQQKSNSPITISILDYIAIKFTGT
ncbi:hypothetical protein HanXRQr2_Chr01g0021471 [Helianthus annuus]|uniref:Uncharacterized protein n=1 Tax=Helianthus annuus TaxID=4232 RepID=A0A9K3P2V0_HELAN|nr:hypothetical protein HanXRQr2_Chr01g0021471 [Helianthus annuus]